MSEFKTSSELRESCIDAIDGALVTRGKHKGQLLAKCPRSNTDAAAAWQAIMGYANPYKLGLGVIMFFNPRQSEIYRAIDDSLDGRDMRALDRDRVALEIMGAW